MPFDLGIIRRQRYVSNATASNVTSSTYAQGGTITSYTYNGTTYIAHIFTSSGVFTVTSTVYPLEWFAVGGGGGGGSSFNAGSAAGGGAGGVLTGAGPLTPVSRVVPNPLYIAATTSTTAAVAGGWITGTNVTDFTGATGNFLFDWRNIQGAAGGARSMPLPEVDTRGNKAFYFEIFIRSLPRTDVLVGLIRDGTPLSGYSNVPSIYLVGGTGFGGATGGTALGTFVAGDTLQIAYQTATIPSQVFFGKNNTWYIDPNVAAGTAFTGTNALRLIMFGGAATGGTLNGLFRAGNENTYAPPTGYFSLTNYTGYYKNPVPAGIGYITTGTTWNVVVGAGGSSGAVLSGANQNQGVAGSIGGDTIIYPPTTIFSNYSAYVNSTKLRAVSTSFAFGTNDFTIEMWIYPTSAPSNESSTVNRSLVDTRNPDLANSSWDFYLNNSNKLGFGTGASGSQPGTNYFLSSSVISANTWTHVALTRNSTNVTTSTFNFWINGAIDGATYVNTWSFTTTNISIVGGSQYLTYVGYISNLRIVNGVSVYNANKFTIPTLPLTPYYGTYPYAVNSTPILFSVTSSTTLLNNSGYLTTATLTTSSQVVLNPSAYYSSNTPFGSGGSFTFNGTGTFLTFGPDPDLVIKNAFTWETWVYPVSTQGYLYGNSDGSNYGAVADSPWMFGYDNVNRWGSGLTQKIFFKSTSPAYFAALTSTPTPMPLNQWSHLAFQRDIHGSNYIWSIFLNGVSQPINAQNSNNENYINSINVPISIGGNLNGAQGTSGIIGGGSLGWFVGSMTNIRFTAGKAIYKFDFSVPTQNLTTTQNTSVLSYNYGFSTSSYYTSSISSITTQTVLLTFVSQTSTSIITDFSKNNIIFTTSGTVVTTSSMMSPFYAFTSTNPQTNLLRAYGGGGGGNANGLGQIGGSGGGGGLTSAGGPGIAGQGYAGGRGGSTAGGGGGYSAPGQLTVADAGSTWFPWYGGKGGDGAYFNYTGISTAYAGGGGGGGQTSAGSWLGGPGGLGGGGNGGGYQNSISGDIPAYAGSPNTGGGGGGGMAVGAGVFDWRGAGAAGGSGIVVFRYPANLGDADRYPTDATDTYFKNTTLLLSANQPTTYKLPVYGSTGSVVTIDYLIVAGGGGGGGGTTSSVVISGSGFVSGSLVFNGTNQYLTVGTTSDFAFLHNGAQDYTLECWFYTNSTAYQGIMGTASLTANTGFTIETGGGGPGIGAIWAIWQKGVSGQNIALTTAVSQFSTNVWNHLAMTFTSSSKIVYMFINGQRTSPASADLTSWAFSSANSTYPLNIGYGTSGSGFFSGYITNVRITKSILYSAIFSPSMPLSLTANTQLYLTASSDATKLVDSAGNFTPLTNVNGVTWQNSNMPGVSTQAAGAMGFTSGQYLTIAATYQSAWSFSGDFTVEAWVYWPGTMPTDTGQYAILSNMTSAENRFWELQYYNNTWRFVGYGTLTGGTNIPGWGISGNNITGQGKTVGNTWYHIAATRSGTTGKIWVGGVDVTLTQDIGSSNLTPANVSISSALYIGQSGLGSTYRWTGYITNVRITKDVALYNTNFTPVVPLGLGANTTVLLLFGTSTPTDSSTNAFPVVNNGSAAYTTSIVPSSGSQYVISGVDGGGGGAGGLVAALGYLLPGTLNSDGTYTLNTTTYTITVGTGGSGGASGSSPTSGSSGTNSSISFSNTNIVAYGGGSGATYGQAGGAGGSGGGSPLDIGGSSVGGQGNAGSPTVAGFPVIATITSSPSGGGGGAGNTGTNGTLVGSTTVGGTGGIGSSSTIITAAIAAYTGVGQVVGTSVYFAGGGSGNGATAGAISYGNGIPGSLSFNGSSYVSVPYNTRLTEWWTTDYTLEAWIYPTDSVSWWRNVGGLGMPCPTFIGNFDPTTAAINNYWSFGFDSSNFVKLYYFNGAQTALTSTLTVNINQWNHIGFTKTTSGVAFFCNGVLQTAQAYSGTPQNSSSYNLNIGQYNGQGVKGYVSNLRIVKGQAVYTGNFITPKSSLQTTQAANPYGGSNTQSILTASYTSLLLVPQSTYDSSIYANVVSNVGGVVYVNTNTPYTIPSNGTGGGGLGGSTSTSGTTGSSGVVVIRYNSVIQDATYTPGTATFINTGGYKTYIFTATGTLSFSTSTLFNTSTYVSGTITSSTINNRAVIDTSYNYLTSNLNTGSLTFTQGSFSPYGSLWSTAFNGTSDYFSFTSTGTAFAQNTFFGSNKTFTVESWLYTNGFQTASTSSVILGDASPTGGQMSWSVGLDSQNRPMLFWRDPTNTNYFITATNFLSTSTWNHVAWVVNAGTPTIFVNGIYQLTTASSISTLTNTTQTQGMVIGAYGGRYYNGFISNLRAVSGTALYNRDPTNLNQKSLYFDGTNQSLSISKSYSLPAVGLYSTPYTVECWTFSTTMPSTGQYMVSTSLVTNIHFVLCTCTTTPGDGGPNLFFGYYNAGTWVSALSSTQLPFNRWNHVAGVYDGVQHNLYLNGVKIAVSPGSVAIATTTTNTLYIGRRWDVATSCFAGYISNVRLVIGTAVYTSNFTPPTTNLTSITNTVLLTLLPTDATVVDSSINASSITPAVTPVFVTGTYPNVLPSFSVPTSPLPARANTVLLTMNSNQFVDSSTSTIALSTGTATSTPKIQRFSPFSLGYAYNPATLGGSALFNGTSDFIYTNTLTSTSTALQLGGSGLSITTISIAQSAATGIFSYSFSTIQGTSGGARSTPLRDSGSYYFEVVYNSGTYPLWGLVRDTSGGGYSNVPSIFVNGDAYGGMTGGTNLGIYANGDIIRIAYNASTNKVWIGRNGAWYLDPASTAGSDIPGTGNLRFIVMSGASIGTTMSGTFRYYTANTYSPPTGFTNATYSGGPTIAADAAYNAEGWVSAGTDYSTSAATVIISTSSSYTTGGDFTIEMWLYVNSLAAAQTVFDFAGNYGNSLRPDSLALNIATSGFYSIATNNSTSPNSSRAILPFTWNHIAMVRSGSLISIFQNGSPTLGYNTTTNYSAGQLVIGRNGPTATSYFNGYISDFRIVKRALYSNTFNPPVAPLTPVDVSTSTSLLLNFNQASLIDKTALTTLTPQDGPIISTSVIKYNPGSFYFNGTSDYLNITPAGSTATYALGVSDFTVEMWVYALPVSTWVGTQLQPATVRSLFDMRTINLANVGFDIYLTATGTLNVSTTGITYITGTTMLPTNLWHHISLVRRNNIFVLFLNGIQEGNLYSGSTTQNFTNSTIRIGFGVAGVGYFNGYIDEVRITKGVARYSITSTSTYYSSFVIPQKASSVK